MKGVPSLKLFKLYLGTILWNLQYLFQVDQTQGKEQVWMIQPRCVGLLDTAPGFSQAASQTAYQQKKTRTKTEF